ncbi:MAG: UDP-N-acetylmuramoyl-L-alanyl-D-glutamate--2,6-diaminopimelate ligase [Chloroflexota bacterium]
MTDGGHAARDRRANSIATMLDGARPRVDRQLEGLAERLMTRDLGAHIVGQLAGVEVTGVTADSEATGAGSVFVAIPGARADGHAFVPAAVRAGAAAVVVERLLPGIGVPQLVVNSSRRALAETAAWWFDDPSRELAVIGITGTDGKTTTSLLAAAALEGAGIPAGLIGTVATQVGGIREMNVDHSTTPEAPLLQRSLRAMVDAGDRVAILETTSHGLAMERVAAIDYDVAILTNLTHEHLELHGSFEAYRAAKVSLFERLALTPAHPAKTLFAWPRTGIVNLDDPSASAFVEATRAADARLLTYGANPGADVRLTDVVDASDGMHVAYEREGHGSVIRLRLTGHFNAYNALAVVALGHAMTLDPEAVRTGLEGLVNVPGRMERVDLGQPFTVIVDYAHSPASLGLVLDELGPIAAARGGGLIAVFGSAGERDRDKRPMMGRIAAERCRIVIVTDEDPRGEDRLQILTEIAGGARKAATQPEAILEIADRSEAIHEAFARARTGDIVVLAGKGHETTIEYADHQVAWNERSVAERALEELGFRS